MNALSAMGSAGGFVKESSALGGDDAFDKLRRAGSHASAAKDGAAGEKGDGVGSILESTGSNLRQGLKDALPPYHVIKAGQELKEGHVLSAVGQALSAVKGALLFVVPGGAELKGAQLAAKTFMTLGSSVLSNFRVNTLNSCLSAAANKASSVVRSV